MKIRLSFLMIKGDKKCLFYALLQHNAAVGLCFAGADGDGGVSGLFIEFHAFQSADAGRIIPMFGYGLLYIIPYRIAFHDHARFLIRNDVPDGLLFILYVQRY